MHARKQHHFMGLISMLLYSVYMCLLIVITGFLVLINCYSVKFAARVMVVLTVLKFLAILFILALGIYEVLTG